MEFDFGAVETLDTVPEQFRPLYTQGSDGKHVIPDTHRGVVEAITGLNKALKAARAEGKAKAVDLSPLAEFGDTPEKIKEAFSGKLKTLEDQLASGGKINVEKIKQEFTQAHAAELAKRDTRNQALQSQLYGLLVDNSATMAIAEARGVPELLLPFLRNQVKVVEEDGKFHVFVVDPSGDRRFSGVTGQPMSIKELVAEMKADKKYGRLFESEALSGGGKDPASSTRPLQRQAEPRTPVSKIAAGLRNGQLATPRQGARTDARMAR